MIVKIPITMEDGTKLVQRFTGMQFEDGTILRTNYLLHKIGTDEYYGDPIDLEDAAWEYEETDIPINPPQIEEDEEPNEPEIEVWKDGISDAEFRRLVEEAL